MLEEKQVLEKMVMFAQEFRELAAMKQWAEAKCRYDTVLNAAVFLEMTEKESVPLFGDRGERGVIRTPGQFPEETVMKVMEMVSVRGIPYGRGR